MWSDGTEAGSLARTRRIAAGAVADARERSLDRVRQAAVRLRSSRATVISSLRPQVSALRPSRMRHEVPKPH